MKRVFTWGLVLLLSLSFGLCANAQNSGSITGTVVDQKGGLISGAEVKAVDEEKGIVVAQATTSSDGLFVLQPLQPGTYTVRVSVNGMKSLDQKGLVLDSRQVLGLGELTLQIGATSESITVEATSPLVDTASSEHASVIDSKQVTETLLNGRDFQSLMKTLPGVLSNNGSDFQLQFNNTDQMHVNGLRGSANNVFLDGAINTDVGANDGQFTQLSMDAVGEFKVQTSNFAAEYGRNPGVLIAINTKSGGQQYHGTLYEFNREDGFGAIPFGQSKTSFLRFNQYGGNIGGPIPLPKLSPRNNKKMFFFFNYEGTRGLRPGNGQFNSQVISGLGRGYTLPDPKQLTGDFTSAYKGPCLGPAQNFSGCFGHTIFQAGQIFVPGSITYDPQGNPINGTPICGTAAAPCNIIPGGMFSAQAPAWVKYWTPAYRTGFVPLPSSINGAGLFSNVFVPFNETYKLNKHQEVVRYDWNINAKTNFFFRWVDDSQQEEFHNLFDFADYPILPEFRKKPGSSWSWNLVNTISPTITNEFIFSYNHLTQKVDILQSTPKSTFDFNQLGFTFAQLFPNSNIDNRAPVLNNCCNGTFTGGSFRPGWHSEARQFTWTDNVTKIYGPHSIKFGVFFDYNQAGQQPVWNDTVFLQFNTGSGNPNDSGSYLANVLLGNFTQAQQTNGVFFGAFRFHQVEAFGEDSWKVSRKLTLDFGLRWAYLGPTYTVQPFFQNYFDPSAYDPAQAVTLNSTQGIYFGAICSQALQALKLPGQAVGTQCPGVTNFGNPFNGLSQENHGLPLGGANHRYDNFGPRFGFAYDVFGNGKTAVRGGAGVFYERIRQNVNSFDALGNPPLANTATVFNQNLDNLGPQDVTGVLTPAGLNAFDKQGQIPTIYGYSLGVQQELPFKMGLEVAYVGNLGRHLQYQYNLNALPVGAVLNTQGKPQPFFANFMGYSNINWTSYSANSSYNSLQAKVIRRFGKGLVLTADYVWSKAMDLEDNDNGNTSGNALTDPFNPKRDYARAGFDRKHAFNLNSIYTVPDFFHSKGAMKYVTQGWEVGTIWKWWSGTPLDVTINGNAGNFVGVVRPDLVAGVPVYLGRNKTSWLNPAAFAEPINGSVGNIGRNAFTGPGINNWDMSLFKNFNFTEHAYLQLRLEAYNVFNHPQANSVNVGFNSPGVGKPPSLATVGQSGLVSGYRDPRNLQLAAKFYF